jgi:DNA-binding LytR/AlgR family response regulator
MRLLVAEDERPQREELVRVLTELWPEAAVVPCADGLEALEAYDAARPDVAFVDLRMPGLGGLELARALAGVLIVFVTAHDDAAIHAFEQGAVDYLLKPVRRERLALTLLRVQERLRQRVAPAAPPSFPPQAAREGPLRWISASIGDTVRFYPIDDVLAFQSQDKYTRVLTRSDDAVIRTSLRELGRGLDPNAFWHVHRSVIVRAAAIEWVKRDAAGRFVLALKGRAERFPVSTSFQRRLRGM